MTFWCGFLSAFLRTALLNGHSRNGSLHQRLSWCAGLWQGWGTLPPNQTHTLRFRGDTRCLENLTYHTESKIHPYLQRRKDKDTRGNQTLNFYKHKYCTFVLELCPTKHKMRTGVGVKSTFFPTLKSNLLTLRKKKKKQPCLEGQKSCKCNVFSKCLIKIRR